VAGGWGEKKTARRRLGGAVAGSISVAEAVGAEGGGRRRGATGRKKEGGMRRKKEGRRIVECSLATHARQRASPYACRTYPNRQDTTHVFVKSTRTFGVLGHDV